MQTKHHSSWLTALLTIAVFAGCTTMPYAKEKYLGKVTTECAIAISVALQDFKVRLRSKLPATKQSFADEFARRLETTYCTEIPDGLVVHFIEGSFGLMDGDIVIYLIDREDYTIIRRGFDF